MLHFHQISPNFGYDLLNLYTMNQLKALLAAAAVCLPLTFCTTEISEVLVEAESFSQTGGWVIDQQSMDYMGSPYLLAHGFGTPVEDASTVVRFPEAGTYHIYVRTYNWTSPWHDGKGPGAFRVAIDGAPLKTDLGSTGNCWEWQYAGKAKVGEEATLSLKDATGFDGRCDAIYFTTKKTDLAGDKESADALRRRLHPHKYIAADAGDFDFVVAGGGVAGICAAVAAARSGVKVALVHNRPILGGNNSSEVRVHLGGAIDLQPYPNLGNLLKEFGHSKFGNARPAENYEDGKKLAIVENEPNISLFLNCHCCDVEMDGHRIKAVLARNIATGELLRFEAPLFADCTGDASVGYLAGADFHMGRESKAEFGEKGAPEEGDRQVLGASVQWYSKDFGEEISFPVFEYGMDFSDESVQRVKMGEWTWETGMMLDQVAEAEKIRDYGMLVVYSNWSYLKNRLADNEEFRTLNLDWVAYVAGKRESRRLLGDVILTENDIVNQVKYEDATASTSWSIDLHYPDPKNTEYFPGTEFKSICTQERIEIYPVPYRCLYSRNVSNLFMAGRNISVTHVALGTTRVMRTTAMFGEVVGLAASVCKENGSASPKDVYTSYFPQLQAKMKKGAGVQGLENNQLFNIGR